MCVARATIAGVASGPIIGGASGLASRDTGGGFATGLFGVEKLATAEIAPKLAAFGTDAGTGKTGGGGGGGALGGGKTGGGALGVGKTPDADFVDGPAG